MKVAADDSDLPPPPLLPIHLHVSYIPSSSVQHKTWNIFKKKKEKIIYTTVCLIKKKKKKTWLCLTQRVEAGFQKQEVLWEKTKWSQQVH